MPTKTCTIIATGRTYDIRADLKEWGFQWDTLLVAWIKNNATLGEASLFRHNVSTGAWKGVDLEISACLPKPPDVEFYSADKTEPEPHEEPAVDTSSFGIPYWLIWSNEHSAWWRAGGHGYTVDVNEAGRFMFEQAAKICSNANCYLRPGGPPNEVMSPAPESICHEVRYVLTGEPVPAAD